MVSDRKISTHFFLNIPNVYDEASFVYHVGPFIKSNNFSGNQNNFAEVRWK